MINLKQYGYDSFFEKEFEQFRQSGFEPGRVIAENKQRYIIVTEYGEMTGEVTGKFLYDTADPSSFPKTGDWVVITYYQSENKCIIHNILKRRSYFSRGLAGRETGVQIIAANINFLFIVQSFNSDFNINRIERYLLMAEEGGCTPAIILNKSDLAVNTENYLDEIKLRIKNIPLFSISCETGDGIEELSKFITENKTYALVGSSGVGKSSIINILMNSNVQKISSVRLTDGKGKHTTTRRELFLLSRGGIIIDSPGMREFGLWKNEIESGSVFANIAELSLNCKFTDCTHTHEKGCAVKQAVKDGKIKEDQLINYLKLKKETTYLDSLTDKNVYLEKKRKEKMLGREIKRYFKNEGKNRQ